MKKFDVLIIGAGVAGLTAGIYTSRANLKTAILEKSAPGGKLVNISQIENWVGDSFVEGPDLALRMWNHSKKEGVEHLYGNVIKINDKENIVETDLGKFKYKYLIIATGTSERIPKEIKNIEKFYQKGVSYCAICDGPIYKGEEIAVIGGGNSAFEESIYLSSFVKKVKIFVRDKVIAEKGLVKEAEKRDNIKIFLNRQLKEINGDKKVSSVLDDKGIIHYVTAVFPYVGLNPNTSFITQREILNQNGFIKVNEMMQTKIKNIFGVGDILEKTVRQLTTAAADGTIAAKNIVNIFDS